MRSPQPRAFDLDNLGEPLAKSGPRKPSTTTRLEAALHLTYRMITSREQARTQRFPDEYILRSTPEDVRLQAGNAVPSTSPAG